MTHVECIAPIVKSCCHSDKYILVSGTITITGNRADDNAKWAGERKKE